MEILDFPDQGDLPLANFCPVIYNHILECGEYCNSSYSGIIGDSNNDFIVNILDCIVLVNVIMGNLEYNCENLTMGNNNGDLVIDILDVLGTLQIVLNN